MQKIPMMDPGFPRRKGGESDFGKVFAEECMKMKEIAPNNSI